MRGVWLNASRLWNTRGDQTLSGLSESIQERLPELDSTSDRASTLVFQDNTLLPMLFGDHDRHLIRIEQALRVRIACRGNRVAISGDSARVLLAKTVLLGLWSCLERGESIGPAEIEAAIRLGSDSDLDGPFPDLPAIRTRRGAFSPRSQGQLSYMTALAQHEMVFGIGPAGTGKTYLAVAHAVAMLLAGKVERVILSRPVLETGERLGFLPGDLKEKIDPYFRPLYDALYDMMPGDQVARRKGTGEIEILPLALMRGRTFPHCYAILDEAQNATEMQMKMFLTRMGPGTRMAITGDLSQVDLPKGVQSGLHVALDKLERIKGIGVVRFGQHDIISHPLVARIVGAWDTIDKEED